MFQSIGQIVLLDVTQQGGTGQTPSNSVARPEALTITSTSFTLAGNSFDLALNHHSLATIKVAF